MENYDHYLSRFLGFIKNDNPADITDSLVREFRLWLNRQSTGNNRATGQTLSKKTQNYYLIAIRAFLKYLARQEIKSMSPERIELAKVGERSLDLITHEELVKILNSPNGNDLKDLRDKAILELLFSTGLRVSELCSLSADIDLNSDELSIRGKGGKVRVVFISDEAKSAIRKYLAARKDMSDSLFVQITSPKTVLGANSKNQKSLRPSSGIRKTSNQKIRGKNRQTARHQSRHFQKSDSACIAPHVCDRLALKRRRPALGASTARPCQHRHHSNLHPCHRQTLARDT